MDNIFSYDISVKDLIEITSSIKFNKKRNPTNASKMEEMCRLLLNEDIYMANKNCSLLFMNR